MTQISDSTSPHEAMQALGASDIRVDAEGDWYYQGAHIFREDILEFFLDHVVCTPEGRFCIGRQGMLYPLDVADTPFVVARVDRTTSSHSAECKAEMSGENEEGVHILLRHCARTERLDLASLKVGKDNVMYCRIRGGNLPARFSRAAYYQLAEWIEEDPDKGGFFIELNGRRYLIESE